LYLLGVNFWWYLWCCTRWAFTLWVVFEEIEVWFWGVGFVELIKWGLKMLGNLLN